jgi:hypothetical protein
MRTFILLIFLSSRCLVAQNNRDEISSLDLYYGWKPQFQNFHNQLNTFESLDFSKPLQIIGVGASGQFVSTRDGHFLGHIIYNQIVPQTISVQDTLESRISGFAFSFAYGRAFTTPSEKFALYYFVGFNTGRLRLFGNETLKQKNPFFSPKIGIQPKVKFGRISLTMIFAYEYDLSQPTWRRTAFSNDTKATLQPLKQTGVTGQLGVGYILE